MRNFDDEFDKALPMINDIGLLWWSMPKKPTDYSHLPKPKHVKDDMTDEEYKQWKINKIQEIQADPTAHGYALRTIRPGEEYTPDNFLPKHPGFWHPGTYGP